MSGLGHALPGALNEEVALQIAQRLFPRSLNRRQAAYKGALKALEMVAAALRIEGFVERG